jgi:hypothetical protein
VRKQKARVNLESHIEVRHDAEVVEIERSGFGDLNFGQFFKESVVNLRMLRNQEDREGQRVG